MEPPQSTNLAPGQLAGGGRYELRRLLGQGGMGTVWLAFDSRLKEEVALKFLPPHIAVDAVALDDLRNEALKSRRLTHPNIVRIHDLSESLDEIPFISMEYVDGSNLNELRLDQPGKVFTWDYLQPLVLQLCAALQYAHEEGVVHRDLKPGNIMLDSRGRLKLADFGIASVIQDSTRRTAVGVPISGTPGYMSPQHMAGKMPSVSDDIYSLGATLYELLTSRPPFYSGDISYQIQNVPVTPLDQRLWELGATNEIPPEISALILSCLAKEPEQRPPSAKALGSWINFGSGQMVDVRTTTSSTTVPQPAPKPSKVPLWQIGLAVVGIAAVLIWGKFGSKPAHPTSENLRNTTVATPAPITSESDDWQTILGGKTLIGWEGDRQFWSIRDGAVTGQAPTGWKGRYIRYLVWNEGKVKNFELKFQFKLLNNANSGIMYRATADGVGGVAGYQFEMWKEKVGNLLDVGGEKPRRDLALRGQKTRLYLDQGSEKMDVIGTLGDPEKLAGMIHEEDWNDVLIRVDGTKFTHVINGRPFIEATDDNIARHRPSGLLALEFFAENDQQTIQFRDMKLKRLP
jgi:serine/threonine protein kinase